MRRALIEVAIDGGPLTLKFTEAHCMPDALTGLLI